MGIKQINGDVETGPRPPMGTDQRFYTTSGGNLSQLLHSASCLAASSTQ
jgi:hypothetical protein